MTARADEASRTDTHFSHSNIFNLKAAVLSHFLWKKYQNNSVHLSVGLYTRNKWRTAENFSLNLTLEAQSVQPLLWWCNQKNKRRFTKTTAFRQASPVSLALKNCYRSEKHFRQEGHKEHTHTHTHVHRMHHTVLLRTYDHEAKWTL